MVHPVFTPLKELVKRVSGYFSEGVLENADELLDLYEQSFKIEWDPRESTILLRSKQLMQAFEAGQATLGEVLRDLPKLDQNPAMAHSAELCQKINRHLAGEGAWAEVVEFYHHHCRLSLEPVSLPGVVRELRKSKVADLTLYVTTQILMAAMSTPLDRWDVYFKALVFEIAKRKGFAKILSLANQKFKIDDQLYWMSYPDYNQLKCHQIVFPFVLGECPIHPLPAEILKGLEQGRILRSPPEITLPEARADHPSMIL